MLVAVFDGFLVWAVLSMHGELLRVVTLCDCFQSGYAVLAANSKLEGRTLLNKIPCM